MPSHHTPVDHPATTASPDDRDAGTLSSSLELHTKASYGLTKSDSSLKHDLDDRNQSPTDHIDRGDDIHSSSEISPTKTDDSDADTAVTASPLPELTITDETGVPAQTQIVQYEKQDVPDQTAPKDGTDGDKALAVTTYVVVPPDGGWGWVIVAASFLCNLIVDGIVFTFGNFIKSLQDEFDATDAEVTMVGSLLSGVYLVGGPFVSALANRYGFRVVTISGAVIASLGFAISCKATNITYLYLSYGLVGGIGFSLIYVPSVIIVGFYFERWRAIATGIAVCGSGIGTFVMPPLWEFVIGAVGWRQAFFIQAGIILLCMISGALFRPLKPSKVTVPYDPKDDPKDDSKEAEKVGAESAENGVEDLPLLQRIKQARDEQRTLSMTSLHDHAYPTAAQIQHSNTRVLKSSCLSLNVTVSPAQSPPVVIRRVANGTANQVTDPEKRLSAPLRDALVLGAPQIGGTPPASPDMAKLLRSHNSEQRRASTGGRRVRARSETFGRPWLWASAGANGARARAATGTSRQKAEVAISGARPMYRDDIFFAGSLQRLPQYSSQASALNYTMSVTRLPTRTDLDEEKESRCRLCPEAVRRTLNTMLDLSLLRSPTFLLLAMSGFMTMAGLFVPFMYLAARAEQGNIEKSRAVLLVSGIGIANTLGRVVCGLVSSMPSVNALLINNVALTLGGLGTMLSGLSLTAGYQFTYSSIFGLAAACFASLRSILVVELMGLEKLTNAFGLLCLFQGVAAAIGAPLAGSLLNKETMDYNPSFYLSGALILISAIMCYPLNWLNTWEKRRNEEKNKNQETAKVV